jgi:hypothetical protein
MYQHLAELGIMHGDVRHCHILERLDPADAAPPAYCAFHRRMHHYAYRIIDFGRSVKLDYKPDHLKWTQGSWVNRVLNGMTYGMVVEPWEMY